MIKEDKQIKDVDDFNEYVIGILEAFLETFSKENGLLRDIDKENDNYEEHWTYIYTNRGMKLAERMITRLILVGEKHFPYDEIDLTTPYYQEA